MNWYSKAKHFAYLDDLYISEDDLEQLLLLLYTLVLDNSDVLNAQKIHGTVDKYF